MVKVFRKNYLYVFLAVLAVFQPTGQAFSLPKPSLPHAEIFCEKNEVNSEGIQINENLLNALIWLESRNNPLAVEKRTKARGLSQIRPAAWKDLVRHYPARYKNLKYEEEIFKPQVARQAGQDYLKLIKIYLKENNLPVNLENLLAAYNWGIGNLREFGLDNAPRETKQYIKRIKQICAVD